MYESSELLLELDEISDFEIGFLLGYEVAMIDFLENNK